MATCRPVCLIEGIRLHRYSQHPLGMCQPAAVRTLESGSPGVSLGLTELHSAHYVHTRACTKGRLMVHTSVDAVSAQTWHMPAFLVCPWYSFMHIQAHGPARPRVTASTHMCSPGFSRPDAPSQGQGGGYRRACIQHALTLLSRAQ